MRTLLIGTCYCCFQLAAKAQINFQNPGFEGIPSCGFSYPYDWLYCDYHMFVASDTNFCYSFYKPDKPIEGHSIAFIEQKLHGSGDISQKSFCVFNNSKTYYFEIYSASLWGPPDSQWSMFLLNGRLDVYLQRDSCEKRQLIYHSAVLDSSWHKLTINFVPDSDYQWLGFWPVNDSPQVGIVDIALDALSPIYLINANAVHVANRDTVIYKRGSETPCVPLHATSSIATFDTVRWYKLVNDTLKVPVANGFSTTQCLDSSTTFLIGMRDSVIACAGVEWSWDTIRVWVRDTVLGINEGLQMQDASFQLQPNPVKQVLTIAPLFDGPFNWEISDALGRSILRGNGRDETLVNVEPLQRGAYLMKVEGMVRRFLKE